MMRAALIAFGGAVAAQAAVAETVLVRTAEHTGFTRMVVDFADRPDWVLGREGDAYELRTDGGGINFDLSDVYRRIYAGRIVSIDKAGPGDLRLTTGCDCRLRTELRANGGLIVDVVDGAGAPGDPYEVSLSDPGMMRADLSPAPRPKPAPVELPMTADLIAPNVLPIVPDDDIRHAAAELGASLAQEIGRAAELDLLDLAPGVSADGLTGRNRPETGEDDAHAIGDTTRAESAKTEPSPGPNLRIVTEAERALTERGALTSVDPSLCARFEKVLDPNDWVKEGIGPAGVVLDRKELIDILGQTDTRGFRDLVRGYLYLTFGREAHEVLLLAPEDLVYRPLYAALADIVEDRPSANNALAGMTSCPGHTGLWARLAEPGAIAYKGDTTRPAAFADWPEHLRRALGPRLAQAYLDAGDTDSARSVFRAVARVAVPNDPAFLLLAGAFSEPVDRRGNSETLARIAETRRPESIRAIVDVIDARIEEDVPVGADLAMQAGALAFELSETQAASDLRAAEIQALIHDGLWKAAVTRLEANEPLPDRDALMTDLAASATDRASDADLLWLAARLDGEPGVARPVRADMAARIAGMGIAEMARAALDIGAVIPTLDERRILAEIALLEDRPSIAETYLAGLDTAADDALRTRIDQMRARQIAAAEAGHVAAGDGAGPEAAPPDVTPTLDNQVDVARNRVPPLPVIPEGGLMEGRALLGASADLRGELEVLLTAPVRR